MEKLTKFNLIKSKRVCDCWGTLYIVPLWDHLATLDLFVVAPAEVEGGLQGLPHHGGGVRTHGT